MINIKLKRYIHTKLALRMWQRCLNLKNLQKYKGLFKSFFKKKESTSVSKKKCCKLTRNLFFLCIHTRLRARIYIKKLNWIKSHEGYFTPYYAKVLHKKYVLYCIAVKPYVSYVIITQVFPVHPSIRQRPFSMRAGRYEGQTSWSEGNLWTLVLQTQPGMIC